MDTSVLSSTFLLTLLSLVGLVFFIRASVKARIQVATLLSEEPEDSVLQQLQQYFMQRAYRVATIDATQRQVTFEGFVRPSRFLAIFLTVLAAIGVLCLSLVLGVLFPKVATACLGLVLLSPLAGLFYWRGAARPETVLLKVEPAVTADHARSLVTVTAHRDELAELQRHLSLRAAE